MDESIIERALDFGKEKATKSLDLQQFYKLAFWSTKIFRIEPTSCAFTEVEYSTC